MATRIVILACRWPRWLRLADRLLTTLANLHVPALVTPFQFPIQPQFHSQGLAASSPLARPHAKSDIFAPQTGSCNRCRSRAPPHGSNSPPDRSALSAAGANPSRGTFYFGQLGISHFGATVFRAWSLLERPGMIRLRHRRATFLADHVSMKLSLAIMTGWMAVSPLTVLGQEPPTAKAAGSAPGV